ncbi:MAG: hypothetical protein LBE64_14615 [Acinetobacter pittii]|jgi:hypothetical protein|nr:hypothetical protein [Acinetobacter pittii]
MVYERNGGLGLRVIIDEIEVGMLERLQRCKIEIFGERRERSKLKSQAVKQSRSKEVKKPNHLIRLTLLKCHTAIMPYHAMEWATRSLKKEKKEKNKRIKE